MAREHKAKTPCYAEWSQDLFFVRTKPSRPMQTVDQCIGDQGVEGQRSQRRIDTTPQHPTQSRQRHAGDKLQNATPNVASHYCERKAKSEGDESNAAPLRASKRAGPSPGSDGVPAQQVVPQLLPETSDLKPDHENSNERDIQRQSSHASVALVSLSWGSSLLTTWHDDRDRINRWILHTLGSDEAQVKVHYQMFVALTSSSKMDMNQIDRDWGRLVHSHWFVDEAACPSPADGMGREEGTMRKPQGRRSGSFRASSGHRSVRSFISRQSLKSVMSSVSRGLNAMFGGKMSLKNNPPSGNVSCERSETQDSIPSVASFREDVVRELTKIIYKSDRGDQEVSDHAAFLRQLHELSLENHRPTAVA